MKKISGFEAALEMLQGLNPDEQNRILQDMSKSDSALALELEKHLVSMEDLKHATPKMIAELLREINMNELGLALKICSDELKNHFKENISSSLYTELEDIFKGPPVSLSKVNEATTNVMIVVKSKVDKGELILRKGGERYV